MKHRSYDELIKRLKITSNSPRVKMETLGEFEADGRSYPLFLMRLGTPGPDKINVVITAGIHGDEPASVEAAVRFLEINTDNDKLLSNFHFTIFPCNNPTGWERNTRENWQGIDLNRQFAARKLAPEVALIMRALEGRCFDIVFEMHEDIDAPGFYLYEIAESPEDYVGERIVQEMKSMGYPVNHSECIEGMEAISGIIGRKINLKRFRKTKVPQAIYIYRTCGGHVLTLEPPVAVLPLEDRVKIELAALYITLDAARCRRSLT